MPARKATASPLAKRLKQARLGMGLSQREVGLLAGLDPSVASARINQYERQTHHPNYAFVRKLSHALRRPVAFFYAQEDELAELICLYGRMSAQDRTTLIGKIRRAHD